jgi:phosphate transport system substrate-binding protein
MQDVPLVRRVFLALLVSTGLTAGCSDRGSDAARLGLENTRLSGTIRISGSTTMAPMIDAMTREFQKLQPGVSFDVRAGGSGQGLKDLKEGKSDIAMVSRTLSSEDRDWLPFVVARDGIAVAIHADNPVHSLSDEQIAGIYTKKILNWREVGGRDAPVSVVGAPLQAGTTELFLHQFRIRHSEVRADVMIQANGDRFAALSRNPDSILYSSLGESERRTLAGEKVKALPSDGIAATSDNLAAGRYAVARPLALVTKGLPTGPAKAFIDYVRSAAATPIITRFEFVPYRD